MTNYKMALLVKQTQLRTVSDYLNSLLASYQPTRSTSGGSKGGPGGAMATPSLALAPPVAPPLENHLFVHSQQLYNVFCWWPSAGLRLGTVLLTSLQRLHDVVSRSHGFIFRKRQATVSALSRRLRDCPISTGSAQCSLLSQPLFLEKPRLHVPTKAIG
jgi:hypothetical protein